MMFELVIIAVKALYCHAPPHATHVLVTKYTLLILLRSNLDVTPLWYPWTVADTKLLEYASQ